jgi:hypothetical protein
VNLAEAGLALTIGSSTRIHSATVSAQAA